VSGALLIRRLLQIVPLLVGVSILGFSMMQLAPGGFTALYTLNPNTRAEDIERIKRVWGLDRPLYVQYLTWARNMFTGTWGNSFRGGAEVRGLIVERVPATLELMGTAYALAMLLGLAIGSLGALRQYSIFDYLATTGSLVALSVPTFWFGLVVIYVFADQLRLIPSGGYQTLGKPSDLADRLLHLVAPALVLALVLTAQWSRYFRSSILEVMHQDYVRTAHAKGLPPRIVFSRHTLRNALLPIVALAGVELPLAFNGALVTESVFGWAGMGRLFLDALTYRDFPVLMALLMVTAFLVIVGNLIADIATTMLDPRTRV
jgi:peptide/nickel transport system permease protein